MVGTIMASYKLQGLARSAKSATELPPKLHRLRNLRLNLKGDASSFPTELLPLLFDLLSDQFAAVRKFVAEIVGEIGLNYVELIPEIIPLFIKSLQDDTPAVVRQVIASGSALFRSTLHKFALQGLHSSELDEVLQSSWTWMLKFKDEVCSVAFKQGNSGVKLCAMKFVEALILLYTPDPSASLESPSHEGIQADFNISVIRGGHPVLNIGDLSIEASQKLALLLDQLRHPAAKSLNSSTIVFLINSLSSVAKKRPAFCGRILPVLLSLDAPSFLKGVHAEAANLALKTVFLSCLECTHPAAAPWKDRLIGALKEIEGGSRAEKAEDLFYTTNGSIQDKDSVEDTKFQVSVEENSLRASSVVAESKFGRKRSGSEYSIDLNGDALTGKRSRTTPSVSGESSEGLNGNSVGSLPLVTATSTGSSNSRGASDTGPVQQLVAMFGALVAQGEKAIGSLEILISSISADLLADVVMANMHNIQLNGSSYADGTDELVMNMSIVGSDAHIKYPPSFVAGVLSLSTAFPPVAALINPHTPEGEELCVNHVDQQIFPAVDAVLASGLSASSVNEEGNIELPPTVDYSGNVESGIPGLDSSAQRYVLSEAPVTSVLGSTNVEAASKNQDATVSGELLLAVIPSVSVDKSEEFSPKATGIGSNSLVSSTAISLASAPQFVLPKISAPVVNLSDEEKDSLQKLVFLRIVEAYKQVSMSGGSQLRFSLLAHLGVEFPSELDPWKMLQEHILSDYLGHEGHELTVRVLYRLYGEAEAEQDFFSSTTAASAYESFLVAVAEALRDSFPPSDKSLSKLLGDSPFLPKSVLKLLESFCCPESGDKVEKDLPSGDRVTQGLSAVWSLILTRPGIRNDCLKIALQSAVHQLEEIRMKAIRLVANKLYSLSFITQQIEEFAKDKLFSVVSCISSDRGDAETLSNDTVKPVSGTGMDSSSEATSSTSITEAQRCLSLYFALCTKKHTLFVHVFSIYKDASDPVKQAIHRQIPILVRTMGSSSELLKIIADPPSGSENLLMQVLQTLTEGAKPSSELIHTIRKLFDTRIKDVEIIFPILPFLPRDDVLRVFPHMVNLPMEKFQVALSRVLQGSSQSGPVLTPSEVLIAIHGIDPARDGIPLKQVTDACNTCFAQRQTFTQQVLAGVLNQLVQQIPLPMLFMRTVLQAIGAFPALSDFILEILSRLVSKQIWKYPKLWVGFLKCAQSTQPQSYKVLLQLPPTQLGNALTKISSLRAPLAAHASQPDIQSSLPRSTLAVLGLVPDSQGTQTSQVQASEAQESQVQASETQESQVQASEAQESQVQESETRESQVQESETQENQVQASETQESQEQQQASESQEQTSQSQQVSVPLSHSETDHNQEASQSQSSPIGTGQSETSQSQSSPIGAGQSEMSQTTHVSDSDPPAPTSHTQTSDSQVSDQRQADDEKMEDTATSENERSEVEKSMESSAEED